MDYVVGYIIILVCKFFGFKVLVIGLYSLLSYEIFQYRVECVCCSILVLI